MADEAKMGTQWQEEELDAIVADYFDMLRAELTHKPYVKAKHRHDLSRRVRWVAAEDGDGAGYDVLSFEGQGDERLIEVKTTDGSVRTPFFLSRNGYAMAGERQADWRIYRVHLFASGPRIFTIAPPLENSLCLIAETWRASFSDRSPRA